MRRMSRAGVAAVAVLGVATLAGTTTTLAVTTTPPTTVASTASGPTTTAAPEGMLLTDSTGRYSVRVPQDWTDTDVRPAIRDDGGQRPTISASPDLGGWLEGWAVPGMFSSALPADVDPATLLRGYNFGGVCHNDGVVPYSLATRTMDLARAVGIAAFLITWEGEGHVPYAQHRQQILDTTTNFLYSAMNLAHAAR